MIWDLYLDLNFNRWRWVDAKDPSQLSLLSPLSHTMRSFISTLFRIGLAAALAFLSVEGLTSRRTGTRYVIFDPLLCLFHYRKCWKLSRDFTSYRSRPSLCPLVLPWHLRYAHLLLLPFLLRYIQCWKTTTCGKNWICNFDLLTFPCTDQRGTWRFYSSYFHPFPRYVKDCNHKSKEIHKILTNNWSFFFLICGD